MNFLLVLLLPCLYFWILSSKDDENVFVKLVLAKFRLISDGLFFMVYSSDNKGIGPKKNPDPDKLLGQPTTTKTIVFIRHGESDWNNIFNKGINLKMIVNLVKALIEEVKMFTTVNSTFLDSPLNMEGIEQALELSRFIDTESEKVSISDPTYDVVLSLAGKHATEQSVIVSSSLRRAIATTTLGLWPRISRTGDKIQILSSLQEISRNIDTYALAAPHTIADLPFKRVSQHCGGDEKFSVSRVYDLSQNFGNKTRDFYGIKRLRAFGEWAMAQQESTIIVGGHSLWFKSFFQTFLPFSSTHEAKAKKITNSGVVSFTLHGARDHEGVMQYRIDPETIQTIYGGFTTK